MKIKTSDVKKLRELSLAGYLDCKRALEASDGDILLAIKHLRKIGHKISQHSDRQTNHGVVEAYIHPGNRIGAMVELRCETDFVAKTYEVKDFAREIAMQVAAMSPSYISRQDVPADVIDEEQRNRHERLMREINDVDRVREYVRAQMERWYSENCVLEQPYIKDGSIAVKDLLSSLITAVGENCKITKIQRWEIGVAPLFPFYR